MVFQVAVDQYGRAGQVLMAAAHVSGIPHAFVLDDEGVVQYHGHPANPEFERIVKQVCTMLCCLLQDPSITSVEPICMSLDEWQMLPCRCVNALILPLYYTSIVDS